MASDTPTARRESGREQRRATSRRYGQFVASLFGRRPSTSPAPAEEEPSRAEQLGGELGDIEQSYARATSGGQRALIRDARERQEGMEAGQETAMEGFDTADAVADEMVERVGETTDAARRSLENIPAEVRGEFERVEERLDAAIEEGRTGLAGQRNEALDRVMQGSAQAISAATQKFHALEREQTSKIDAMVQQGQLSPSQARMMKSQVGLQSAMDIGPAIGQTVGMFRKMEADVGVAFGNMFASMESVAVQTTGQLGAAAGTSYAQTQGLMGKLNVELAGIDAQAESQRASLYGANAAARSQARATFDSLGLDMMDFISDRYTEIGDNLITRFEMRQAAGLILIKSEHADRYMDRMEEMDALQKQFAPVQIGIELFKMFF